MLFGFGWAPSCNGERPITPQPHRQLQEFMIDASEPGTVGAVSENWAGTNRNNVLRMVSALGLYGDLPGNCCFRPRHHRVLLNKEISCEIISIQ